MYPAFGLIYQIKHRSSGKAYVGKTTKLQTFDKYWGSGKYIKRAVKKEGIEAFEKSVLFECFSEEELNFAETFFIKKLGTRLEQGGYNLSDGGEGIANPSSEVREVMRQRKLGKIATKETRKKMSQARLGRKMPPISEESRKNMSLAHIGKSNPHPGVLWSDERKQHFSEIRKKKVRCVETEQIFLGIKDASEQMGLDRSTITKVAKGKSPHTKGFHFVYID